MEDIILYFFTVNHILLCQCHEYDDGGDIFFFFSLTGHKEIVSNTKSVAISQDGKNETTKSRVCRSTSFTSGNLPSSRKPLVDDTNQTWLKQKAASDKGISIN